MQEALLSGFKSSGLWTTHATTHIIFSDTVKRNRLADRWAEILGLELEQVNEPAVVWSFERELLKNLIEALIDEGFWRTKGARLCYRLVSAN